MVNISKFCLLFFFLLFISLTTSNDVKISSIQASNFKIHLRHSIFDTEIVVNDLENQNTDSSPATLPRSEPIYESYKTEERKAEEKEEKKKVRNVLLSVFITSGFMIIVLAIYHNRQSIKICG